MTFLAIRRPCCGRPGQAAASGWRASSGDRGQRSVKERGRPYLTVRQWLPRFELPTRRIASRVPCGRLRRQQNYRRRRAGETQTNNLLSLQAGLPRTPCQAEPGGPLSLHPQRALAAENRSFVSRNGAGGRRRAMMDVSETKADQPLKPRWLPALSIAAPRLPASISSFSFSGAGAVSRGANGGNSLGNVTATAR
jgi:hypothetical protein